MTKVSNIFKKDINLIPEHVSVEKQKIAAYKLTLLAASVVVVFMVVIMAVQVRSVVSLGVQSSSLKEKIESLKDIETLEQDLQKVRATLNAKKNYEKSIDELNSNMLLVLDLLERIMPEDVLLSALVDGVAAGGERTVTIEGSCSSKTILADFENKLRESDVFSSVFVPEITQADQDARSSNSPDVAKSTGFSIVCSFRRPGAEQGASAQDMNE